MVLSRVLTPQQYKKTDLIRNMTDTFEAHAQETEGGIEFWLDFKIAHDVHVLMRDADDVDSMLSDFIEDQVHAFREAIVTGFYFLAMFFELRLF
jgi:hypothetical protein